MAEHIGEKVTVLLPVMEAMLCELTAMRMAMEASDRKGETMLEELKALRREVSTLRNAATASQDVLVGIRESTHASQGHSAAMVESLQVIHAAMEASEEHSKAVSTLRDQASATATLEELGKRTVPPGVGEVTQLVGQGAEVGRLGRGAHSAMHHWAREGRLELVKALLQTPHSINFRTLDEVGDTPFHSVLSGPAKSDEAVREMMGALVARLELCLTDTGEDADESGLTLWEVKNAAGRDILHLAIVTGHLSVVYPLLKDRPYYSDRECPIELDLLPSVEDWDRLSLGDRQCFALSILIFHEANKSNWLFVDQALVKRCLSCASSLTFRPHGHQFPSLHLCIMNDYVDLLKLLLKTPCNVDFTVRESHHFMSSPLHRLAGRSGHRAKAMLTAILDRLSTHPNDTVDWSQKNVFGRDFVSDIAFCGNLATLYPMVKGQPYYVNAAKPLVLACRPSDEDWARLSKSDQSELERPSQ